MRFWRLAAVASAVFLAAGLAPLHAADWGTVATVSSSMGVNAGKVCIGEGSRGDIGCPSVAPSVDGTTGVLTGGGAVFSGLTVTGSISASAISATTLSATTLQAQDANVTRDLRIGGNLYVSGAQSFDGVTFANGGVSATGTITATSFSGAINASNVVVSDGVSGSLIYRNGAGALTASSTLVVSGGNVGIGTATPGQKLDVNGLVRISGGAGVGALSFGSADSIKLLDAGTNNLDFYTTSLQRMRLDSSGNLGIGTSAPTAKLQVSGTFIVSNTAQITTPSIYVSSGLGYVGIGTSTPSYPLDVSGNARATLMYVGNSAMSFSAGGSTGVIQLASGAKVALTNFSNGNADVPFLTGKLALADSTAGYTQAPDVYLMRTSAGVAEVNSGTLGSYRDLWARTISATNIQTSGTVYAGSFSGDGSGLTGVVASSGDRIVSGSTSMLAVSATGYISVTQSGVNTGWFDPQKGFVTIGVSSTGPISATSAYLGNRADVVSGTNRIAMIGSFSASGNPGIVALNNIATANVPLHLQGQDIRLFTNPSVGTEMVRITSNGLVGIGTVTPTATLQVSGVFIVSNTAQVTTPSIYVSSGLGYVGIGTSNPGKELHVAGSIIATTQLVVGGNLNRPRFDPTYLLLNPTSVIGWSETANAGGASSDVGLSRYTTGTLAVGNGVTARDWSGKLIASNIGVGLATPTTALEVSGTISATNIQTSGTVYAGSFSGDGSGLSGVVAGSSDRITSGTTSMLAVSSSGFISVTQSGVNTAWFDPQKGFVTIGVSSTGPLSGTTGYFTGNIIVSPGSVILRKGQSVILGNDSSDEIRAEDSPSWYSGVNNVFTLKTFQGTFVFRDSQVGKNLVHVTGNNGGAVGIGITPTVPLHVSGTARITSWTMIGANASPTTELEVSGTVSATNIRGNFIGDGSGLTGVVAGSSDRIVSGTTSMLAVSNTGFVSLTQSGVNTGWFDPQTGFVTIGVSSTGPISGTRSYFSSLGVGNTPPSSAGIMLATDVRGTVFKETGGTRAYMQVSGTNMALGGNGSGSAQFNHVFFNNSGNVGMGGITSPATALEVSGTTSSSLIVAGRMAVQSSTNPSISLNVAQGNGSGEIALRWANSAAAATTYGQLNCDGSTSCYVRASQASMYIGANNTGFSTYLTAGGNSRLTVLSGGQVGIGTVAVNPSASLHVSGTLLTTSWTGINFDTGVTATAPLEVSGTISATRYVGDGSGLTGVVASSGDRIVSGSTSMLAVSNTGYISVTQSGVNTAWFDPQRGFVTIGVSSTGTLSGTAGYFSNNVGIGTSPNPSYKLYVSGGGAYIPNVNVNNGGGAWQLGSDLNGAGGFYVYENATSAYRMMIISNSGYVGMGTGSPSSSLHVVSTSTAVLKLQGLNSGGQAYTNYVMAGDTNSWFTGMRGSDSSFRISYYDTATGGLHTSPFMTILSSGRVGMGTTAPAATLQVSGTFIVSNTAQVTTPSIYVSSGLGYVGVGTSNPAYNLDVAGDVRTTGISYNTRGSTTWGAYGSGANYYFMAGGGDKVVFTSTGKVGISAVNAPSQTLHVGGSMLTTSWTGINFSDVANVTPTAPLEVSGTISATRYVGDGSGLTGVVASSGDRIVSGSTSMLAVSDSGFISVTQSGVNTGWFDPQKGFVTIGVSSTGGISGTSGYFSGKMGVGTLPSSAGLTLATASGDHLQLVPSSGSTWAIDAEATALSFIDRTNSVRRMTIANAGDFNFFKTDGSTSLLALKETTGFAGIGTGAPNAKLDVIGTVSASNVYVTGTTGTVSATYGYFTNISGTSIYGTFTGNGSGLTGVVAGSSDRIVSGTTSMLAVSNTGFISVTQSGVNTAWFDPQKGFVTIGVSSTGGISGTTGYYSGNVGIGTIGTTYPLDIRHSGYFAAHFQTTAAAGQTSFYMENDRGTFGSYGGFLYGSSASGLGNLFGAPRADRLFMFADGASNLGMYVGTLGAQPFVIGTNNTEAMRVVSTGYVGIGIATPSSTVHISGTSAGIILSDPAYAANPSYLKIWEQSGNGIIQNVQSDLYIQSNNTNRSVWIEAGSTNGSPANSAIRFANASGVEFGQFNPNTRSLAMGTTNPSATVHVSGTVLITSWTGINFSSLANVTPTAPLEVSGTISATRYVGDGSGLTGVVASSGDRIVSGTTSMLAVSNTGYISVTQSGVNTAWFDPSKGFVTIGVSSTGGLSGTTGYFSGDVGIGLAAPTARLHISATTADGTAYALKIDSGTGSNIFSARNDQIFTMGSGTANTQLMIAGTGGLAGIYSPAYSSGADNIIRYKDWNGTELMRLHSNGFLGVGTAVPNAKLEVAGSISASNVYVTGTTGTVSATYGYFTNISGSNVYGGTASFSSMSVGGVAVTGNNDRIVSGTAFVKANLDVGAEVSGTLTFTNSGSETCGATSHYAMRINPTTGKVQFCRP